MALLNDVKNFFKDLENPENVEETLLELSQMNIPKEVLDATNACWLIMSHFEHATCGDLARSLAMDWMRIRSPKMPALIFKREADTEDTVPHKRRRFNEEEESYESVNSIEDETEEEFNPFLSENSHGKSSIFSSESNKENAPEAKFEKSENVTVTGLSKKVQKKPTSTPLATSTSSSSNSIKKTTEEIRLEEIATRIARTTAEKEAKHRKTVILAEHDYTNSRRRAHLSK